MKLITSSIVAAFLALYPAYAQAENAACILYMVGDQGI